MIHIYVEFIAKDKVFAENPCRGDFYVGNFASKASQVMIASFYPQSLNHISM